LLLLNFSRWVFSNKKGRSLSSYFLAVICVVLIVFMQFLTELDGVETLTGVFVFAATRLVLKEMLWFLPMRICLFKCLLYCIPFSDGLLILLCAANHN
jgi:hypothetical protein